MAENNSKSISSNEWINIITSYVTSKKMIYLVVAIVLAVGIYYYMNKKKNTIVEVKQAVENQEPEIIFSQELVQNLYSNNSNPVQYLKLLQQQGQIPNGPLPKIVLDNNVPILEQQQGQQQGQQQQQEQQEQQQEQQQGQQHQEQQLEKISEASEETDLSNQINYNNEVKTANSINNNYQKIEEDDDDALVNQKLTKEEVEKINRKILNKN